VVNAVGACNHAISNMECWRSVIVDNVQYNTIITQTAAQHLPVEFQMRVGETLFPTL